MCFPPSSHDSWPKSSILSSSRIHVVSSWFEWGKSTDRRRISKSKPRCLMDSSPPRPSPYRTTKMHTGSFASVWPSKFRNIVSQIQLVWSNSSAPPGRILYPSGKSLSSLVTTVSFLPQFSMAEISSEFN